MKHTPAQLQAIVFRRDATVAIQAFLDNSAKESGYDSIMSACSYTGSLNFGKEAQSFLNWRDAVWTYSFTIEPDVVSGVREIPTIKELLAELPKRVI